MGKIFLVSLFITFGFYGAAAEFKTKGDLIVGVFDFSSALPAQKVAESAEKLKVADPNFINITVAEIHKNTYGIYFTYRSNEKINTPDKLVEMAKPLFKEHGKHYEGQHISNSTIVIK
jgi:hypothetical protein